MNFGDAAERASVAAAHFGGIAEYPGKESDGVLAALHIPPIPR